MRPLVSEHIVSVGMTPRHRLGDFMPTIWPMEVENLHDSQQLFAEASEWLHSNVDVDKHNELWFYATGAGQLYKAFLNAWVSERMWETHSVQLVLKHHDFSKEEENPLDNYTDHPWY